MICTRCLLQRRAAANATSLLHPPTLLAISSRSYSLRPLCFSPLSSRRLSRYLSSFSSPLRQETITITTAATTTTTTTAAAPSSSPPFSTPFTPGNTPSSGSGSPATTTAANTPPQKQHPRSKTPAGVPLKGLGYLKNQETPKAWADDEYPEWLWGLLNSSNEGGEQEGIGSGAAGGKGDFYSKSKKQRRIAAKAALLAKLNGPSDPVIPLQHQSIDLAYGEGNSPEEEEGRKAREDLKKTMRQVRRKAIKERNFLTGMK